MKAIVTSGLGRHTPLVVREVPRPTPGRNDLLVAVCASSVNPKDWKLNRNIAAVVPSLGGPLRTNLFGDDLSGIVVDKGRNVTGFEIGDAVYGMDMRLRTNACAEFAIIDQRRVALKPANLSHEQAAAVPLAAQTAVQAKLVIVESWQKDLETLTQWIEAGRVTPVIDTLYPMAALDEAYQHSKTGRARGKIVIQVEKT